jgi:hypothetical protein
MLLATRKDYRVQDFLTHAQRLGQDNAEIVFHRDVMCGFFNEPLEPQNQIFLLRPAKPRELPASYASLFSGVQRESFDVLVAFSRYEFPHLIADFRICADAEHEGQRFLRDSFGQRSPSRSTEYFHCHSARLFRHRCLKLECGGWRGSDDALPDFYAYCAQGA